MKSGKMEGGAQTDTFGIVLGADYVTASQNFVFGGAFAYTLIIAQAAAICAVLSVQLSATT